MNNEEEHRGLHKRIYECKCMPMKENYCKNCEKAIVDFMNKHGAGALTQDTLIENLKKRVSELGNYNKSQANKIKRLEVELTQLTGNLEEKK